MAKKKDEAKLTRQEEIALLTARINKMFDGKGAVLNGAEFSNVFTLRRPTGITQLDIALGGGWPAGGLSQIIGREGSTKSYIVNRTIANVQNIYGDESAISACMTEMPYDKSFAKWRCGVRVAFSTQEIKDLEKANLERGFPAFTKEQVAWLKDQVGVFQQSLFATAEQLLEAAVQQVESNLYQIVLIDSFGALLTAAEAEAEEGLEQKHRGGASGVITQFMHRLHAALNLPDKNGRPNTTTVLGINQYRENVGGGLYAPQMREAGGYALKHGKLVDLHLEVGGKQKIPGATSSEMDKIIVGKEIRWDLIKGKAGCHDGPKGSYMFYFGEHGYGFGADVYQDLLAIAARNDVIEQSGSWYSFNGERICQGKDNAAQAFMANPTLFNTVRDAVFQKANVKFIVKEDY